MNIIEQFEGRRLKAYLDGGGVPTIGVGHTKGVKMGDTCTDAQADKWLEEDTAEAAGAVDDVRVSLNANQLEALTSFVFNVGVGAFRKSTLLRLLNGGDYQGAADQLLRWDKDNGKTVAGLTRRRQAERKLFLS